MFLDLFKNNPRFRKLFFRKRLESEKLFSMLTAQTQFSGLSFVERQLLLSYVPSQEEVQKFHQELCEKLNAHIKTTRERTVLSEIPKSEIEGLSDVYAAKIFTYLSDNDTPAYLVYGIYFYRKFADGKWVLSEKPPEFDLGFSEKEFMVNVYPSYPEEVTIAYYGCFGEVHYVSKEKFTFYDEHFYVASPAEDLTEK